MASAIGLVLVSLGGAFVYAAWTDKPAFAEIKAAVGL